MAKSETFLKFGKNSEELYSILNDRAFDGKLDSIQLFMLAATYGFTKNRRSTDFPRSANGPRTNIRASHLAILSSIHLHVTQDVDSLLDFSERDRIAEEFAEGGIRLLHDKLTDPTTHSFINWLSIEMRNKISKPE